MTVLETQPLFAITRIEGGSFLITSSLLPVLVTKGHDLRESIENLDDALGLILKKPGDSVESFGKVTAHHQEIESDLLSSALDHYGTRSFIDISFTDDYSMIVSSNYIPSLSTGGKTPKEMLENLKDALDLLIEYDKKVSLFESNLD